MSWRSIRARSTARSTSLCRTTIRVYIRPMSVDVAVVNAPTEELVSAVRRLLPQLSTSALSMDHGAVQRMLDHDANTVFVARVAGEIVGMLTLVMVPIPSGLRARIEDVVVD